MINRAKKIRKDILLMHYRTNSSHIGSALSCVEILLVLFFRILKKEDYFILSKAHGDSALYAVLAEKKMIDRDLLEHYRQEKLYHYTKHVFKGIELSRCCSLGHGLSIAVGLAIVKKRVFILLSDGECQEGSIWEAIMCAGHHRLDNLTVIVDYNKMQAMGNVKDIVDLEPFKAKWEAFGCKVKSCMGHDIKSLIENLQTPFQKGKPSVLIAHTVKGKGISFMENKLAWHYRSPKKEDMEKALKEL